MARTLRIKRVYEPTDGEDGLRVLVDRLWPRGLSKDRAAIDLWLKEIAPSTDLRKWFHHEAGHWKEFEDRYRAELDNNPDAVGELRKLMREHAVTLVYGARDEVHNHALVLRDYLET